MEQKAWRMFMGIPNHDQDPKKATLFLLVYGSEAVLPLKIQLLSLRIALTTKITKEEKYNRAFRS